MKRSLLNPITLDQADTLIAGLHRLEAAKLLGWTEIEYTVSGVEGLEAELAEIDENVVRTDLSTVTQYNRLHRSKIKKTLQLLQMKRLLGQHSIRCCFL